VVAIETVLERGPFRGRISELHKQIQMHGHLYDRHLPKTPQHLSNALARLKPAMSKIGIYVELEQRTRDGRVVLIWKDGQDPDHPAEAIWPPRY
jgi:hypothetical protein